MTVLPIIDICDAADVCATSTQLMKAGRDPGFFYVTGHGIPATLLRSMFQVSIDFFKNCSEEDRRRFASASGEPGYSGVGREKLSGLGRGDVKESYHFQSFSTHPYVELPETLDSNRDVLREFSMECERVGNTLLEALSVGLEKPITFLARHHKGEQNRFRLLHYPPFPTASISPEYALRDKEEDIRAGAHSDYGSITLLFQQSTDEGGLQVWTKGAWLDVPYVENAIVVNIGDALEFWSAGKLRSTIHRVIFPPSGDPNASRYSIPFFVTADDDTILEPILPRHEALAKENEGLKSFGDLALVKGFVSLDPITARAHRLRREATIGGSSIQSTKNHREGVNSIMRMTSSF